MHRSPSIWAQLDATNILAMSPAQSRDFSGVDERLVQLSDPPGIRGYRIAPEKHRELESVVPIPSARRCDGWAAEGDWPNAVNCLSNGEIIMRRNVLFIVAILLVAGSQPSAAQIRVDMNNMTCGNWLGYSPKDNLGICPLLDERLLQCRVQQQHPKLRPSAKKFCKGCGAPAQADKSQSLPTAIKNIGLWD